MRSGNSGRRDDVVVVRWSRSGMAGNHGAGGRAQGIDTLYSPATSAQGARRTARTLPRSHPGRRSSSMLASLSQRCRQDSETPKSLATWTIDALS